MNASLFLGLDIGTTNVKAAAFLENGEVQAEASVPYPTYYPYPGWAEQAPDDWKGAITAAISEVTRRLAVNKEQVVAMGLSAHAPGFVPVDPSGNLLLERVPIWSDERSLENGQRLLDETGPEWIGLGMPFASFGAKLRWYTDSRPEQGKQAAYVMGVKAYIAHWLCGEYATDPSSEPGRGEQWERLCDACNWPLEKLVPLRSATDVVGELRTELVKQFQLEKPIPIVLGLNDGASATLGNAAVQAGEGVIVLGTNGVIFLVADQAVTPDVRLKDAIFCWPYLRDRWVIGGQTKSGAVSLQWYLGWSQPGVPDDRMYSKMLEECAEVPAGSRGVSFLPYLMGMGTPNDDPSATSAILGLSLQSGRAALGRAVLEGVAFSLRDTTQALLRHNLSIGKLMVTGGGARSELWRQIVADVLDRPLRHSEGDSCLGAAMLAAVGIAHYADVDSALEHMRPEVHVLHPQPEAVKAYRQLYGAFEKQRDVLLTIHREEGTSIVVD
jgi:xylulokinase